MDSFVFDVLQSERYVDLLVLVLKCFNYSALPFYRQVCRLWNCQIVKQVEVPFKRMPLEFLYYSAYSYLQKIKLWNCFFPFSSSNAQTMIDSFVHSFCGLKMKFPHLKILDIKKIGKTCPNHLIGLIGIGQTVDIH